MWLSVKESAESSTLCDTVIQGQHYKVIHSWKTCLFIFIMSDNSSLKTVWLTTINHWQMGYIACRYSKLCGFQKNHGQGLWSIFTGANFALWPSTKFRVKCISYSTIAPPSYMTGHWKVKWFFFFFFDAVVSIAQFMYLT